jgi:uncharacterized membrane protein YccF (DUF307 family)
LTPSDISSEEKAGSKRERARHAARKGGSWAGYGWFMTLGTILPLIVFIGGYVVNVTLVGGPIARRIYRFGIWLATLGQEPPGQEKFAARKAAKEAEEASSEGPDKKSLIQRIGYYSPPEVLERRGKPVSMPIRVVWFVMVGWWLGVVWVIISWGLFLLPYPMLDAVSAMLAKLPSVMTLAWPDTAASPH